MSVITETEDNNSIADIIVHNNRPGSTPSNTFKLYSRGKFICNSKNYYLKKRSKSLNNIDFYNKRIMRSLKKSLYKSDQIKLKELCPDFDFIARARTSIIKGKNHKIFIHNIKYSLYQLFYRRDLHYKLYYFFNVKKPNEDFDPLEFIDSEEESLSSIIENKNSIKAFKESHKDNDITDSKILKYAGDDYNVGHYKRGQELVSDLYTLRMHKMDAAYYKMRKKAETLVSYYINNPSDPFWDDIFPEYDDPIVRKIFISNFTSEELDSFVSLLYDSYTKEYETMRANLHLKYQQISKMEFDEFMQMSKKEQQKFCDSFFYFESNLTKKEKSFNLYSNVAFPISYDYQTDLHFNIYGKFRKKSKINNLSLFNVKKYSNKSKRKRIEE